MLQLKHAALLLLSSNQDLKEKRNNKICLKNVIISANIRQLVVLN